jgi:hypothetical protein
VVSAGRAVDHIPGVVGAPGLSGELFGGAQGDVVPGRVEPDIGAENRFAQQVAELIVDQVATLVPRGGERDGSGIEMVL